MRTVIALLITIGSLLALPALAECQLAGPAEALAELIGAHSEQQRVTLVCDPRLVAFAQARAEDMATRRYFDHVDLENVGPNQRLLETGFRVPDAYPLGRNNNIESMVGGLHDANQVFDALVNSSRHRPQILGELEFYRSQDRFGVGYAYEPLTPEVDIWVIVIAREAELGEPQLDCTPPPGACRVR